MKSCIKMPRLLLPREDFEGWVCPPSEAEELGAGRASRFYFPRGLDAEEAEKKIAAIRSEMYRALEEDVVSKLERGFVYVERQTARGVRRGVVGTIDLERYSFAKGEESLVRAGEAISVPRAKALAAVRRKVPLECTSAVVLYRDKRRKALKWVRPDELELLYETPDLKGYFIEAERAAVLAEEMHGRGEPAFLVAEGNDEVAAAKLHWDTVKKGLRPGRTMHPARFVLVEFVNLFDDEVELEPVHRLVKTEDDAAALLDYLGRNVKCRREGNLVLPDRPADPATIARVDELLATYCGSNGGKREYVVGEERLREKLSAPECVGVRLGCFDKGDLFPYFKGGKTLPRRAFSLGAEERYYCECREVGYD